MKFCFVAPIFYLNIDSKINNGLKLDNMNISNTDFFLKKSVLKKPFTTILGDYLIYDFYDTRYGDEPIISPHFYFERTLKGVSRVDESKELEGFGTNFVTLFLIECQKYLESLWYLRDNAIYIRDGFVKFYDDGVSEEQRIFRYSLKEIYFDAQSERKSVTYKKHELEKIYRNLENKSDFFNEMQTISKEKFDEIFKNYLGNLNLFSKKK